MGHLNHIKRNRHVFKTTDKLTPCRVKQIDRLLRSADWMLAAVCGIIRKGWRVKVIWVIRRGFKCNGVFYVNELNIPRFNCLSISFPFSSALMLRDASGTISCVVSLDLP
jgi:hypothetical protein